MMDEKTTESIVLVVEDEEMNYLYLQVLLRKLKIGHHWVTTGEEAIAYCMNHEEVGLVLMDVKLPGISGLEATREILKIRSHMPVIAVTAYAMHGDRQKADEAGCVGHVAKPINRQTLESMINNYFLMK